MKLCFALVQLLLTKFELYHAFACFVLARACIQSGAYGPNKFFGVQWSRKQDGISQSVHAQLGCGGTAAGRAICQYDKRHIGPGRLHLQTMLQGFDFSTNQSLFGNQHCSDLVLDVMR